MAEPAPAAAPASPAAAPKLDELMMAMDVVDTLRHQEGLAVKELGQSNRDAALKGRLRELYESQGLAVSDAILDAGIAALKESRFTYVPPPPGLGVTLARLWVRRGLVARVAGVLALVVLAAVGWQVWSMGSAERAARSARVEIEETLPAMLERAADAALAEARDTGARDAVNARVADARAAFAAGDAPAARTAIAGVEALRAALVRTYELRIVSRPGEPSGVFRIPDANEGTRNYYLIVEAVTPGGEVLSLPVTSEEDQTTETVPIWGVRVSEEVYDSVREDKQADGIVDRPVLAEKPRGSLEPVYLMPVLGGTITRW